MSDNSSLSAMEVERITQQPVPPSSRPQNQMPSSWEVAERQDGLMRKQWEKLMCKQLGTPQTYQKVAVLILRWDDSLDTDLKCRDEVEELKNQFSDGFNFTTQVVVLNNFKRPQVLIDSAVSQFVAEHDGNPRSNLLIVYYTGHGFLKGPEFNSLIISGKPNVQVQDALEDRYPPEAKWDQAEITLNDAEADVLTILDCCFAGSVMKPPVAEHSKIHVYELLAACGKHDQTEKPGKRSYTRALVDSLKSVLQRKDQRILTFDLNQMILTTRSWNARPHLYNRLHTSTTRHICLTPLTKKDEASVESLKRNAGHLNLRLAFKDLSCLSPTDIEALSASLCRAVQESNLAISAIDWMGFQPYQASKDFKSRIRLVMVINRFIDKWTQKKDQSNKRKTWPCEEEEEVRADSKRRHTSYDTLHLQLPVGHTFDDGLPTPGLSSRGTPPN